MINLSLRPYIGSIALCASWEELRSEYKRITSMDYPYDDTGGRGRYAETTGPDGCRLWFVYADAPETLAHELCHVLLHTFAMIGHIPTNGDGEPFCYMLSQLMIEAKELNRGTMERTS